MAKKPKFTPSQIKEHVKKIQDAIEKQKRENQLEHFRSPQTKSRKSSSE